LVNVAQFRLGFVDEPCRGHEQYRGCLAIPYIRITPPDDWKVVSIRFRRLSSEGPKYQTVAGDHPRLYNTAALLRQSPVVAITEGEIDAITAEACGVPCVGVPGAQAWKTYYREPFLGYETVYVLADGDEPGMQFAQTVKADLPNAKVIPSPPGEDVNSLFVEHGAEALKERLR
jgi:DNA primase